jgi:hypothetical protein
MADDSGIDPRHPAQFQRGYDPAATAAPLTASPTGPPRHAVGPPRLPGGPLPSADRVVERVTARVPEPRPATPMPPAPDAVSDEAAADEQAPRVVRWEEWGLLALAVVLVVPAVALIEATVTAASAAYSSTDASEYAWMQIRAGLPGPLLVGAAVALVAWVVLRVVRKVRP